MIDTTHITLAPLLSWVWLTPLVVLAGIAVLFSILQRARGAFLRLLALAILTVTLLNPVMIKEQRNPIKDVAVIVVDRSQSQEIGKRTARTNAALQYLKAKLDTFPDLETRIVEAGKDSSVKGETDLFAPLQQTLSDVPRNRLAGAILLTDGQAHDVPDTATSWGLGPMQVLLTGEHNERDRRISIVAAPAYGLVGKTVPITLRVDDTPNIGAKDTLVKVMQDGVAGESVRTPIGVDKTIEVTLSHGGQTVIEVEAEPVADELTLKNNRAAVMINAVRDRLKVLLVSGEPYPGERTWRNLLKADASVDLVHFTILRSPEKQDATPIKELSLIAFPIRELFELKLKEFDLVIFDRYEQRGILPAAYYENLANYVREGGALLDASGPVLARESSLYHTAVGDVLPSDPGEEIIAKFRPIVTDLGKRHPVTSDLTNDTENEWGSWFRQVSVTPKAGSVVMAGAEGKPLLILSRVGEGRVAQLTSDQIWLWTRGYEGGGPSTSLIKRMAHWLMKEPELEENDLHVRVTGDKVTVERVGLEPNQTPVTIIAPSGADSVLALTDNGQGRETGTTTADEIGVYKLKDDRKTVFAVVGALDAPEFREVVTTEDKVKPIAKASGGSVHWLEDDPKIGVRRVSANRVQSGGDWIGLTQNGQYTVSGVQETALLPVWLLVIVGLGGIFLAWRREGK